MKRMWMGACVAAAMVTASIPARANVGFAWYDDIGLNTVSGGGAYTAGKTVLTYLSTDTNVNHTGVPFQSTYGDDVFFKASATISDGYYDTGVITQAGDASVGKFVYAVALDLPFASFTDLASIPGGTKWGVSDMGYKGSGSNPTALVKTDTEPATTPLDLYGNNIELIPEPASAALLVLGGAAAFWRRRRNRR